MITKIGTDSYKGQEFPMYLLVGRACKDGECKDFSGKEKGSVSVKAKEQPDGTAMWVEVTAWRENAHLPANVRKGDTVLAIGKLSDRLYHDKKYWTLDAEFLTVSGANRMGALVSRLESAQSGDFAIAEEEDGELPF